MHYYSTSLPDHAQAPCLIGRSPAMQALLAQLPAAADRRTPLLIAGEPGTGKEPLARVIHAMGPRADAPFVTMATAAMPRELIEHGLFGQPASAFGAALAQRGLLEQAGSGTLFIDEIANLPPAAQTRLAAACGADHAPARLVAATAQKLEVLESQGRFQAELLAVLRPQTLAMPPLRARRDDIALLATQILQRLAHGGAPRAIAPEALALLCAHPWPGNIRQLESVLARLCAPGHSESIGASDVHMLLQETQAPARAEVIALKPPITEPHAGIEPLVDGALRKYFSMLGTHLPQPGLYERVLAQLERPLILHSLRATQGNQIKAAEILGINRNTLRKKMRLLGIDGKTAWKDVA